MPTSKEIKFDLICVICMMWKSLVSIPGIAFSLSLSLFNISSISPSASSGRASPGRSPEKPEQG